MWLRHVDFEVSNVMLPTPANAMAQETQHDVIDASSEGALMLPICMILTDIRHVVVSVVQCPQKNSTLQT